MEILLNPLSANRQCFSIEDSYRVVSFYVKCAEFCLPALNCGRVKLLFDENIEQRHLIQEESFRATISRIRGFRVDGFESGKDVVDKWYLYSRNRSTQLSANEGISVALVAQGIEAQLVGAVCVYAHDKVDYWISFPKDSVCEANDLILKSEHRDRSIKNSSKIESFKAWLPAYEPNLKHREESYTAAGGEHVSAMPLGTAEAQALLLTSLPDSTGTRWAFHKRTDAFYCFRKTHVNREIFHGYLEEEDKVPSNLRDFLRS